MLYSIGYQNLKNIETLKCILQEKGILIHLDVRSRPYGKKRSFNNKNLETSLSTGGIDSNWAGKTLGGFSEIHEEDIKKLAVWQKLRDRLSSVLSLRQVYFCSLFRGYIGWKYGWNINKI